MIPTATTIQIDKRIAFLFVNGLIMLSSSSMGQTYLPLDPINTLVQFLNPFLPLISLFLLQAEPCPDQTTEEHKSHNQRT